MSVHVPIIINDVKVGDLYITRKSGKGLPPGNYEDDWRNHHYYWEAKQYHPAVRTTRGMVYHKPRDGVWALVGKAMSAVEGWVMNHDSDRDRVS